MMTMGRSWECKNHTELAGEICNNCIETTPKVGSCGDKLTAAREIIEKLEVGARCARAETGTSTLSHKILSETLTTAAEMKRKAGL